MAKKKKGKWIQGARKRMEEKGTVGKFGKAMSKNRPPGSAPVVNAKRTVFAQNMKKIARKRRHKRQI